MDFFLSKALILVFIILVHFKIPIFVGYDADRAKLQFLSIIITYCNNAREKKIGQKKCSFFLEYKGAF